MAHDKALRRLPIEVQWRIVAASEDLGDDPHPRESKKLKAEEDLCRVRVGEYRIVSTVEEARLEILVFRTGHRKDMS